MCTLMLLDPQILRIARSPTTSTPQKNTHTRARAQQPSRASERRTHRGAVAVRRRREPSSEGSPRAARQESRVRHVPVPAVAVTAAVAAVAAAYATPPCLAAASSISSSISGISSISSGGCRFHGRRVIVSRHAVGFEYRLRVRHLVACCCGCRRCCRLACLRLLGGREPALRPPAHRTEGAARSCEVGA